MMKTKGASGTVASIGDGRAQIHLQLWEELHDDVGSRERHRLDWRHVGLPGGWVGWGGVGGVVGVAVGSGCGSVRG